MDNNIIGRLYKHFKGGYYRVLMVAKNTETGEDLVIYKNINDSQIWARPYDIFFEKVEVNGILVDRMKYVESVSSEISAMIWSATKEEK